MTVIAWDGNCLAADKCAISGGGISRSVTKIWRHGGTLYAVTGELDVALELREWHKAGALPREFPNSARDGKATLIIITKNGVSHYVSGPYPLLIESKKCAFGSGRDYAEATMYLGYSAVVAVQTASFFQSDCGNGIDVLRLPTGEDAL
jgi:hypothetical protein